VVFSCRRPKGQAVFFCCVNHKIFQRGDAYMVLTSTFQTSNTEVVHDIAFAHWQYNANEKAYSANLISKAMYEYVRDELHKSIETLSLARYSAEEGRCGQWI